MHLSTIIRLDFGIVPTVWYVLLLILFVYIYIILQICEFIAHIGLSYAAAFVTSLAFESPMMALEKVVFKQGKKK